MARVLVLYRDDLAAIIESAVHADEVRTLCLVALRALDDGNRGEFPIRSTAAARFGSRGFPFRICHEVVLLRGRAAADRVGFESTFRAESGAIFMAQEHDR